jgi:hypothetical protein
MNAEMLNHIALFVGWAAMLALVVCVIGGGYLCAYEICKAVGSRIFFPVWAWHILTAIAVIKSSKTTKKSMYIHYLFQVLRKHEERHPDLRGLLDEYAEQRISKNL